MREFEGRDVRSLPYEMHMTHIEKEYLKRTFFDEIKKLEKTLDWDCSDWLND